MQTHPDNNAYLIFELTDRLYGVDARLVREVVRLPEITPMEDAPVFILGVINLRGRVVPVLDLNGRLGRLPQEHYRLSDSVVVLEQKGVFLGLLINDIREVTTLDETDIDAVPSFEVFEPRRYRFIERVARVDEDLVMLLAPQHLLHIYPLEVADGEEENGPEGMDVLTARRQINLEGGAEEHKIFRERAQRLMQRPEQQRLESLISLAIVRLNDEMLGMDLTGVAGFTKARQVAPIPCCPEHIVGSMNLRGDILTLIDLRQTLGLTAGDTAQEAMIPIVIVRMGRVDVGMLVHEVVDIIHVQPSEIAKAPSAASRLRKEHLQGAVSYDEKMLGVLNVQAILADPNLLVNEKV